MKTEIKKDITKIAILASVSLNVMLAGGNLWQNEIIEHNKLQIAECKSKSEKVVSGVIDVKTGVVTPVVTPVSNQKELDRDIQPKSDFLSANKILNISKYDILAENEVNLREKIKKMEKPIFGDELIVSNYLNKLNQIGKMTNLKISKIIIKDGDLAVVIDKETKNINEHLSSLVPHIARSERYRLFEDLNKLRESVIDENNPIDINKNPFL